MTKRAQLGFFTIIAAICMVGVVYFLASFGRRGSYEFGVHFPAASNLNVGADVYESGVVVGSVEKISLLPDYSAEVVLFIRNEINIPRNAHISINTPLTGEPTIRIRLPRSMRGNPGPPFPHQLLALEDQPRGDAGISLADFLAQGQEQFQRVDALLSEFEGRGPRLLDELERTLNNANALTVNANAQLSHLSAEADRSLSTLSESTATLATNLSRNLTLASANVVDMTSRLDETTRTGQPHISAMLASFDKAAKELSESVDALHGIAADPSVRENVVSTTRSIAETAATFSALLGDFRKVTGDEKTQGQLRDAVAHIDAATQKADSLLAGFGGKSKVESVDYRATPVPGDVNPVPSIAPAPPADISPGRRSELSVPSETVATAPNVTAANAVAATAAAAGAPYSPTIRGANPLSRFIGIRLRESYLSPEHYAGNGRPLIAPLLDHDRGPQTDVSIIALPQQPTSFRVGADDVGGPHSALDLTAQMRRGNVNVGGGLLYSRLGVFGGIDGKFAGLDADIYDPRRGTVDVYGNVFASHGLSIFAGERDLTRDSRRSVYGLQLKF